LQWLQDPSEINGDNLNNERYEDSRHFRNKRVEYLKYTITELVTNNKNKNIRDLYRGINEFKRGYQPRNSLVKDENGDLLPPGSSHLEDEIAIAKLKKYKSAGVDQILAELIQAGSETLVSAIHKLINSIWNKEKFPEQWKEAIIIPIAKGAIKLC
jgi:hypothetical protein